MIKNASSKFDDYSISSNHAKLGKFYCIGVMNQLKKIFLLIQQINL